VTLRPTGATLSQLQAACLVDGIELLDSIGQGGSSTVWRARWRGRDVAVKVLEEGRPCTNTQRLDHPGILRVLERGRALNRPYSVLERFPADLAKTLGGKPLGRQLLRPVLLQLLDAVDYAHQHNVLHGDLKPANVLVDIDARPVRVALTDFGEGARPEVTLEASMLSEDRQEGGTYATLAYLAPERLAGGEPSVACDVYGFGVLLFEVLTGRLPQGLELPSELQPGVDRRFDVLVKRCLARDPQRRPASASALRREVLRILPLGTSRLGSAPDPREGMVRISGGFLVVGDRDDPHASPMHERQIEPFWIDPKPVTNRDYLAYVLGAGAERPPSWPRRGRLERELLDLPVSGVSWEGALAYARWRGKRLPTEFEWERCAQGPREQSFPYGETFDAAQIHQGLGPVGSSASAEGVYDLTGNGWEWTASAFGPYPHPSPETELRTLRGGFCSKRGLANAHRRAGLRRDGRDSLVTFRCALSATAR
jgi:formylglycine-generating enzyme required for sulfatase activity